jgi:hypothetical protein
MAANLAAGIHAEQGEAVPQPKRSGCRRTLGEGDEWL